MSKEMKLIAEILIKDVTDLQTLCARIHFKGPLVAFANFSFNYPYVLCVFFNTAEPRLTSRIIGQPSPHAHYPKIEQAIADFEHFCDRCPDLTSNEVTFLPSKTMSPEKQGSWEEKRNEIYGDVSIDYQQKKHICFQINETGFNHLVTLAVAGSTAGSGYSASECAELLGRIKRDGWIDPMTWKDAVYCIVRTKLQPEHLGDFIRVSL
jgi:hypothetical protein